jgi:hypothetical protein
MHECLIDNINIDWQWNISELLTEGTMGYV